MMPDEWSPHQATWLTWPHNPDTWPGVLDEAQAAIAEVIVALAPHEQVFVNGGNDAEREAVAKRLRGRVPDERVRLEQIATDDAWIRDYGGIVVATTGGMAIIDFDYNAWGGKYPPFDRDRAVAEQMAERLGLPRIKCDIVLEGGSVDVNGSGLGLVTE